HLCRQTQAGVGDRRRVWRNCPSLGQKPHRERRIVRDCRHTSVLGESRNLWTQRVGREWSTRHSRLNIPLLDLVGPTRDYLEVLYEKTPATRSFNEWSIYHGHLLSKTTYVEGLDLLRQDFTVANARAFLDTVLEQMPYNPKEALYVARWLTSHGEASYEPLRGALERELGGMLNHDPPSPAAALA